jgi:hypothetical protein
MTYWRTSRATSGGVGQSPGSPRAITPRDSNSSLRCLQDNDFAALCFALVAFASPILIGGFFLTIWFAFFE